MVYSNSNRIGLLAIIAIVFASFSINMPTAFISIASGMLLVSWLASGGYSTRINRSIQNRGSLAALWLLGLYLVGTFYSVSPWQHELTHFKYTKLLLIPLIVSALYKEQHRKYALNAFLISTIIVLIISYLKWLGLFPHHDSGQGFSVFKGRIAGSIIMSFGMYMMLLRASKSVGVYKAIWITLSFLAASNIMFLVNGRTGQVTMGVLIILFSFDIYKTKALRFWLPFIVLAIIAYKYDLVPHSRLLDTQKEITEHKKGGETSAGLRLEFYLNTLKLIENHPVIGGGTGSFANEYQLLSKSVNISATTNPHNQYLLTCQELGVIGLSLLIAMLAIHWNISWRLSLDEGRALRGLIATFVVGSAFNSLLMDSSEGKFYCIMAGILLSGFSPKKAQ
jgi:O-antigen ligase